MMVSAIRHADTVCYIKLLTRKCGNCKALQLEAARHHGIRFNFVAHAKFEVAQPIRYHLIALLPLICYVTLWPSPFTLNIRSIPAVPWSNSVPNVSIIEQSMAEFCDLNIWPYELEHVSCVVLCSWIVCTKFKLSQAIRSWNVTNFMLICRFTLWHWALTHWPWKFLVDLVSHGHSL